jgi:hypothetical protein
MIKFLERDGFVLDRSRIDITFRRRIRRNGRRRHAGDFVVPHRQSGLHRRTPKTVHRVGDFRSDIGYQRIERRRAYRRAGYRCGIGGW